MYYYFFLILYAEYVKEKKVAIFIFKVVLNSSSLEADALPQTVSEHVTFVQNKLSFNLK